MYALIEGKAVYQRKIPYSITIFRPKPHPVTGSKGFNQMTDWPWLLIKIVDYQPGLTREIREKAKSWIDVDTEEFMGQSPDIKCGHNFDIPITINRNCVTGERVSNQCQEAGRLRIRYCE